MGEPQSVKILWYGERGILNALVTHIHRSQPQTDAIKRMLEAIHWAHGTQQTWVSQITSAVVLVEIGLADFGNPDIIILANAGDGPPHCVFLEAKIGPYILSMRPNNVGMREAGFNSSINGQLSLKYRFARALEQAAQNAEVIRESSALLVAYQNRVHDPRQAPRQLVKPGILRDMLQPLGLIGLPEERCHYVALTWDIEARAFFRDPSVDKVDRLPCFLDPDGGDLYAGMRSRIGWLGYKGIEVALSLSGNPEYQAALQTMAAAPEPDSSDYAVAESVASGRASAESLTLAREPREAVRWVQSGRIPRQLQHQGRRFDDCEDHSTSTLSVCRCSRHSPTQGLADQRRPRDRHGAGSSLLGGFSPRRHL